MGYVLSRELVGGDSPFEIGRDIAVGILGDLLTEDIIAIRAYRPMSKAKLAW